MLVSYLFIIFNYFSTKNIRVGDLEFTIRNKICKYLNCEV